MGVTSPFTQFTNSARDLGRLIGDPERALPGENTRTVDSREAKHWAAVHAELLEVRLELMQQLRQMIAGVSHPAVAAGLQHNAEALELAINRSRRRLDFWTRRVAQLADSLAAPPRG